MIRNKIIATAVVAAALVTGVSTGASADTLKSSVSDWNVGHPTKARTATQSTQSIRLNNCVWSTRTGTGNPASKSQWQLQTPNSFGTWTSVSNKTQTCNSKSVSWSGSKGAQYRYQFNGAFDSSGNWLGSGFLFSANPIVINY